jgi:hypothetical protein
MARRLVAAYEAAPKIKAAPPFTPPKRVVRAAVKHGLGELVWAAKSSPFSDFLIGIGAAAGIFGVLAVINHFGPALEQALGPLGAALAVIRPLLIWLVVGMLVFVVLAFGALLLLKRDYLFEGGLVRWRNGLLRVLPWRDLAYVERESAFGWHTGYGLHLRKGRPVMLEISGNTVQRDEMARQLEVTLQAAGCRVSGAAQVPTV